MVVAAQGDGAVEIRVASTAPWILVVQLGPGIGAITSDGGALVIQRGEGGALGLAVEAFLAPEVQGN